MSSEKFDPEEMFKLSPVEDRKEVIEDSSASPVEEEEGFTSIISEDEDFVKNPTDFTDPAAEETARRKRNLIIMIVSGILIVILALFFIWEIFLSDKDDKIIKDQVTPTPSSTTTKVTDSSSTKPLLKQYSKAPKVDRAERVIAINKNTALDNKGASLTILNGAITPASSPCKTQEPTDFCLVGKGGLADKTSFDIYYLKDGVNSRLFEEPENFAPLSIPTSPSSGSMDLLLGSTKSTVIATISKNSSGWMLVIDGADGSSKIPTVIKSITVK